MREMKIAAKICVLLVILFAFSVSVFADSEAPPTDYTKETENGQYIFVMLATSDPFFSGGRWVQKKAEIRDKYKVSGLYKNDGSSIPLWNVYWYSFNVFPSSDGKHVVRMGPWAQSTQDLAIAFYKEGKELEKYFIHDLVENKDYLQRTVSHFFWNTELQYNDKEGTVFLKTVDNTSYVFSIKTGAILKKQKNTPVKPAK